MYLIFSSYVNVLYELKYALDEGGVYKWQDGNKLRYSLL